MCGKDDDGSLITLEMESFSGGDGREAHIPSSMARKYIKKKELTASGVMKIKTNCIFFQ